MHSDNQNSHLVVLKAKAPKSAEAILDLLRGHIDLAAKERWEYVCVSYKVDGQIYSKAISLTYPNPSIDQSA